MRGPWWQVWAGVALGLSWGCGSSDDGNGLLGTASGGQASEADAGDAQAPMGDGGSGGGRGDGGRSSGGSAVGGRAGGGASGAVGSGGASGNGGGGAGGAAGGGAGGAPPTSVPCTNSLGCVSASAGRQICDTDYGYCVECVQAVDCAANHECLDQHCVAFTPCQNSLDCPTSLVCDSGGGRCVECIVDADCAGTGVCKDSACHVACASDRQCTPLGLLCNTGGGYCTQCIQDSDCDALEYCTSGFCRPDRCLQGTSRCRANDVLECSANGSALLPLAACAARRTCVETGDQADCVPWVCTAGATECSSTTELVTCAADGLSVASTVDCTATTQYCVAGACSDQVCAPSQLFCQGKEVRLCDAQGLSSTLSAICSSTDYCDASSPSCKAQVCTPDALGCNGNAVATCNSDGSGFVSAGTSCGVQYCSNGGCVDQVCTPNATFCQGKSVRQCDAQGLSSSLVTTCTDKQYCDAVSPSCKAQVCTPDALGCNGNAVATCNSEGSGFLSAGQTCGAAFCNGGACTTSLLMEDFEDGDSVGWTVAPTLYVTGTGTVVTTTAANATAHSLQLQGTASAIFPIAGSVTATHAIPASAPMTLSAWGRVTTATTASAVGLGTSLSVGFGSAGKFTGMGAAPASYVANTWYHFEITNINWIAGTYSVYVNGALQASGVTFTPPAGGTVSSVRLTVTTASTGSKTALWDEIDVH